MDNTEQKILKAARQVFTEKGLNGARMQEIADNAGINKALLHYYFRNKEKLFNAVFEEAFFNFIPQMGQIMLQENPISERIDQLVDHYLATLKANPQLPIFVLSEIQRDPTHFTLLIKEKGIDPKTFDQRWQKDLEAGHIKPISFKHFLANALGMLIFPYVSRPLWEKLFFNDKKNEFEAFLEERNAHIKKSLKILILTDPEN